jgi:AcrR family transcriptional regulator
MDTTRRTMKIRCEAKRIRILEAATELFASRPFHKVLLSDVATAAGVGKGTLYLYFKSKEELYLGVRLYGYSLLLAKLRENLASSEASPKEQLTCIIRELIYYTHGRQFITELLRGTVAGCPASPEWNEKRLELRRLIETVIRRGVEQGVFEDPHPELTALYLPGLVRSIIPFTPDSLDVTTLYEHTLEFVLRGLRKKP